MTWSSPIDGEASALTNKVQLAADRFAAVAGEA